MTNVQGQVPNVLWDHAINGKDRETEWKQLSQVSEIATKVRLDVFRVGLDAARVGVVIVRLEKCVEPRFQPTSEASAAANGDQELVHVETSRGRPIKGLHLHRLHVHQLPQVEFIPPISI